MSRHTSALECTVLDMSSITRAFKTASLQDEDADKKDAGAQSNASAGTKHVGKRSPRSSKILSASPKTGLRASLYHDSRSLLRRTLAVQKASTATPEDPRRTHGHFRSRKDGRSLKGATYDRPLPSIAKVAANEAAVQNFLRVSLFLPRPPWSPTCPASEAPVDMTTAELYACLRRHSLEAEAREMVSNGVPPSYILAAIRRLGGDDTGKELLKSSHGLLRGTDSSTLRAEWTKIDGTDTLALPLDTHARLNFVSSPVPPTHVLAVQQSQDGGLLIPCHALVLALQCSALADLPPAMANASASASSGSGDQPRLTHLPLVQMQVPDIETFLILYRWLYSPDVPRLISELLPPKEDKRVLLSPPILLCSASRVNGLWCNAILLGVHDRVLWKTMESCWAWIMCALGRDIRGPDGRPHPRLAAIVAASTAALGPRPERMPDPS